MGDAVAQIVDHHVDEGMYSSAQRDIQLVGSCATLVVRGAQQRPGGPRALTRRCLAQTEHVGREAASLLDDAALRALLLGAVLLDTGNLTGMSVRAGACCVHTGPRGLTPRGSGRRGA